VIQKIWELANKKFGEQSRLQYEKGFSKYKVPLTNFNGRNPFQDAREEVVDMHQYLTQAETEFESIAGILYVYAVTEGFFDQLPKHIQERLIAVADGAYLADICQKEGIQFTWRK
jgi:hypothetical protein